MPAAFRCAPVEAAHDLCFSAEEYGGVVFSERLQAGIGAAALFKRETIRCQVGAIESLSQPCLPMGIAVLVDNLLSRHIGRQRGEIDRFDEDRQYALTE